MDAAMSCELRKTFGNSSLKAPKESQEKTRDDHSQGEIVGTDHTKRKTENAYKCEAHELTRKRTAETESKYHEEHKAERGLSSMRHYNLVHKFIFIHQAMNIPDAKAADDKEWDKLMNFPAWQESKVKKQTRGHR